MQELIRRHRAAIICSIIASMLCVYFLDPILTFLGRSFLSWAAFLGGSYTDRIYSQAAHLETVNYSFLLVVSVFVFMASFTITLVILSLRHLRHRERLNSTGLLDSGDATIQRINIESQPQDKGKRPSFGSAASAVVMLVTLIWGSMVIGANWVQLGVISSFQQHVRILRPYMDDVTEEAIVSEWSMMSSKADYDRVQAKLERIAEQQSIKLPENRLYSAFSL